MISFIEVSILVKFIERASRTLVAGGWRDRCIRSYYQLMGIESPFENDEEVLEIAVVIAQHCECTLRLLNIYLKMI